MRLAALVLIAVFGLALVPTAAASPTLITGIATSCTKLLICTYTMNNSAGTGTATQGYYGTISVQLPGESKATSLPYTDRVVSYNSSLYHMQGSFLGTDSSTGKVVIGTTFTNISVTSHCYRGCTYTYTLANGSIEVLVTKYDGTSAAFSCTPSSIHPAQSTVCTVTITDLRNASILPTGKVSFKTTLSGEGHFANQGVCTLVNGSCSLKFTGSDEFVGSATFTAYYHGTALVYKCQASTTLYVS